MRLVRCELCDASIPGGGPMLERPLCLPCRREILATRAALTRALGEMMAKVRACPEPKADLDSAEEDSNATVG